MLLRTRHGRDPQSRTWIGAFLIATAFLVIGCGNSASSSVPTFTIRGMAHAGPTCPVVRPGDASCQDRPVAGAVMVIDRDGGGEVARTTTDSTGAFAISLPAGDFVLVPQPVVGLLGTAAPVPFAVGGNNPAPLDISYDTGIR